VYIRAQYAEGLVGDFISGQYPKFVTGNERPSAAAAAAAAVVVVVVV